jgi:transcriptional regulator with PAS, ATPase and Fis domain
MGERDIIEIDHTGFESHRAISQDPSMRKLLALAQSVARTPSTVLLSGESGVGKEIIARYIHAHSPRGKRPFIAVNCAALPSSLLESELFGHEKGSFSGAVSRHEGIFERANGGTILLDEISEVSLEMQAKLLRVLQERSMVRVGGSKEVKLDIRVIATTNRNLRECVDQGDFRLDLYYRLNVFPLKVPPLRERTGDIAPLTLYYLGKFAAQFGSPVTGVSREALSRLESYSFPGNVRELVNVLERAVILAVNSDTITSDHLLLDADISVDTFTSSNRPPTQSMNEPGTLEYNPDENEHSEAELEEEVMSFLPGSEPLTDVRRKIIIGTLERFDGNRTRTAEALGVSLRTIRNKLRDYRERGVDVPEPGTKPEDN